MVWLHRQARQASLQSLWWRILFSNRGYTAIWMPPMQPCPLRMVANAPGNVRLLLVLGCCVRLTAPVEGVAKPEALRCRPYRSGVCGTASLPLEARCKISPADRRNYTLARIAALPIGSPAFPSTSLGAPTVSQQSYQYWRKRSGDTAKPVISVAMASGPATIGNRGVEARRPAGGCDGFCSQAVVTGTVLSRDPTRRLCLSASIRNKQIPRKTH